MHSSRYPVCVLSVCETCSSLCVLRLQTWKQLSFHGNPRLPYNWGLNVVIIKYTCIRVCFQADVFVYFLIYLFSCITNSEHSPDGFTASISHSTTVTLSQSNTTTFWLCSNFTGGMNEPPLYLIAVGESKGLKTPLFCQQSCSLWDLKYLLPL